MIWNTADPYLYMRTTQDNRIIIGGRDEPFYNPVKRDKLLKKKTQQLTHDFQKIFPDVKLLRPIHMTKGGKFSSGFFSFEYQNHIVNLMLDNDELNLPMEKRVCGFAPISYIALNAAGEVYAHEDFEDDARNLIYRSLYPDHPDDEGRATGLCEKIPGLTRHQWNEKPLQPKKRPASLPISGHHK